MENPACGENCEILTAELSGSRPNKTKDHHARCQCGCIPNILSLFEMAKLREERRKQNASKPMTDSAEKR